MYVMLYGILCIGFIDLFHSSSHGHLVMFLLKKLSFPHFLVFSPL